MIVSDEVVRKAVVQRLELSGQPDAPPGFWYRPVPIPAGSFLVLPDAPGGEPEQGFSSDSTCWRLIIMFVSASFDEERATEDLSTWSAPKGPFIQSLVNFDLVFNDTLSTLSQDIRVTAYLPMNTMMSDGETLYYKSVRAQIKI